MVDSLTFYSKVARDLTNLSKTNIYDVYEKFTIPYPFDLTPESEGQRELSVGPFIYMECVQEWSGRLIWRTHKDDPYGISIHESYASSWGLENGEQGAIFDVVKIKPVIRYEFEDIDYVQDL